MSVLSVPAIGLAFFLVGAWLTAAVAFPLFHAATTRRPDLARHAVLVAALPVIAGIALALAAFLPGDPHLDHLLGCHCATSMPGWLHLCPMHPTTSPLVLGPTVLALVALLPGRLQALAALFREPLGTGTGATPTLVDLPQPTAVLAGWLRPSLLVDRHLWGTLRPAHRAALLAHERGHLARRDPMVLAVLRLLTSTAPSHAAQRLLRRWLDHAEHRADLAAARSIDPLVIAEALVACARAAPARPAVRLGWTAGRLEARVHALVEGDRQPMAPRPDPSLADLGLGAVAVTLGLGNVPWLHHQIEHLLNLGL